MKKQWVTTRLAKSNVQSLIIKCADVMPYQMKGIENDRHFMFDF